MGEHLRLADRRALDVMPGPTPRARRLDERFANEWDARGGWVARSVVLLWLAVFWAGVAVGLYYLT